MELDKESVATVSKPTGPKLVLTVVLVFVFALSKVPGVPIVRVPFLSNNLLGPFVGDLYARITVFDGVSVLLSYLLATLVLSVTDRLGIDLWSLGVTVLSFREAQSPVIHVGLTIVTALFLGLFQFPLGYVMLGQECPGGGSCTPSGPALNYLHLFLDVLFWYVVWEIIFAVWERVQPTEQSFDTF